ncbi:hypothetical protein CHLNCDRAFT_25174 [Chlorella variabilis]|uniref:EKC/KEOPS complex subunit cgi121 n=1 Tax=Chlorella variabilis TaxID=554065 RepID=E1ZJK3_CHLVA|nr:hypothetical protein CHLNCDRAFT_25174 [Chlorella variabilis]EFN53878.1 hypothetical protein CHLNCDRAFT_25174 [Chlorella variabilis]|eukprot:XP_005845980.1 hypothetical protein CHLNCDRAFT_25174 [Chlorella variabilis]
MEASIQRLEFEDFPGRTLTVLLFKDVTNSKELRELVMSGALQPECSLANAELVPSLLVLRVAAFKALLAQQRGALRTKSLHAEVVFNLAGSKHIPHPLDRFGINPGCRHLLAAPFDASPEEEAQLQGLIAGAPTPLAELPLLTDQQLLIKHLKVTPEELLVGSLADAMLMRSAGRDC